ncbi:DNA recombination protein RmuC [Anseongella ginsenosidimutans]|uniref:DNA recombination protein RmuC n=1 Tax=Anseongella ginsenosidimutans TaxID=496056 RepID=A0A4R3KVE9_9SPHI|nr:DNA recombination protein RmuC [Anseongella ginsenosidimutans]QEC51578.1 DNA recombination protein RmuC [Anseongella ginsenosidimutans]TCS88904.1 DNA recombination protein RmuC [Anseongella ginsenosidimutans]
MDWIEIFSAFLAGMLFIFFYLRLRKNAGQASLESYNELNRENSILEERNRLYEQETGRLREELREERRRSNEFENEARRSGEAARIREQLLQDREKQLREQKEAFLQMQQQMNLQFEHTAGKLLEEKSKKFTELNRASLDLLLTPLKENIKSFEEKVEKTYKAESDERNVLKGTVRQMMELNKQLSEDTNNLTRALRGDSKKQGNWGEVILSRILERSGLIEGENYVIQSKAMQLQNEDGRRLQPDVIVRLPGNKHVIIDSKVSLVAYERMISCDTEEEREQFLKQHVQSVRTHITGLSAREYASLQGIDSPDFVLLFMPVESSFSMAVQHDAALFSDAWDKKIVVVGPSTLLATLLTVAATWKQEKQTRNAQEIALKAGLLYDKFARFVEDLEKVGKNLGLTQKSYDDAFRKLHSGRGNLLNKVEELRKLGAKAGRQLHDRYLDNEDPDDETGSIPFSSETHPSPGP